MSPGLWRVFRTAWAKVDDPLPRWAHHLLGGLMLAGLAVALVLLTTGSEDVTPSGVALALALSAFALWAGLAPSLLRQNHPTVAHLVPGHVRNLRMAALLSWLILSALAGLLVWAAQEFSASLPVGLLLCATAGLLVIWAHLDGWRLGTVGALLWAAALALQWGWPAGWLALLDVWQTLLAHPWWLLAAGMLIQAQLLLRFFGHGDNVHRARYARLLRQQSGGTATDAGAWYGRWSRGGSVERWASLARSDAAASAWLRRLLSTACPHPASVMARAEFVLHGRLHWVRLLATGSLLLAGLMLLVVVMFFVWELGTLLLLLTALLGLPLGATLNGFGGFGLPGVLWQTRREQALLTLLPGMPQGAAQTRAIVRLQLRQFLIAWGTGAPMTAALFHVMKQPLLAAVPLAVLPVGVLLVVRTPAKRRPPDVWLGLLPLAATLVLASGLAAVAAFAGQPPILVMLATTLASSAVLLAWRWRALDGLPQAMPTGRLR